MCRIPDLQQLFNVGGIKREQEQTVQHALLASTNIPFRHADYASFCVNLPLPINKKMLERFLQDLLWENAVGDEHYEEIECFRIKGLFKEAQTEKVFLVHAVKELYEMKPIEAQDAMCFRLVFIGIGLPRTPIESCLERILAASKPLSV